ncbi:MAG: alpha/beta hydrolase [Oscillospiraceae bacterium]
MISKKIESTPMWYYISENKNEETILFLHSAFADHTQYAKQIEDFSQKFTVVTVDLIGHGNSTETQKGDGIDKTAQYLKDILQEENISKVHLVGVSIGAVLVQDFANKYPEMVASIACFGGYDINNFDTSMQKENGKAQGLMMLKAIFSIKWFAQSNKLISAYTTQAQEEFYQMNIRFPKKSFMYLAGLNGMVNKCITKRSYPVLIGCGDKDIPMELKAIEMWHALEPNSEVVVFKNAGHLVNMDASSEFNKVVIDFVLRAK